MLVTFLPGLVPAGHSVGWLSLLLGSIFVVLAVYFAVLIAVSGRITHWLRTAHIRRRMDRVTGAVPITFGVRLAIEN